VVVAVVAPAAAVEVADVVADELDELLAPHAASSETSGSSSIRSRRQVIPTSNGSWPPLISCSRMSDSAPVADLPMTTALELPGMRIRENLGVCYGLVVRSMGFTGGVAASFKGLRRGEIPEYTQLLEDSRRHAIDRMSDNARLLGADAIVAVRFDSSEIGQQFTEIVAYGTAVKVDRA
jgi:uncharacterized protein YbjQ (UPF0145 family)